jgi:ribosomal silencing factor RsfS
MKNDMTKMAVRYSEGLLDDKAIKRVRKLADQLTGPEILYLINLQLAQGQNWFVMYSGIYKKQVGAICGDVSHVTMNGNTVQFNMEGAAL